MSSQHPAPQPPRRPSAQDPRPQGPRGPVGFGWGLLLVILVIGSGTLMAAAFPYSLLAVLFSAGALLLAVLMLRPALRPGVPGAARGMGIMLVVVTAFGLVMSLMALAVAPLTAPYRDCVTSAVTQSGRQKCNAEYEKTLQRLGGGTAS